MEKRESVSVNSDVPLLRQLRPPGKVVFIPNFLPQPTTDGAITYLPDEEEIDDSLFWKTHLDETITDHNGDPITFAL